MGDYLGAVFIAFVIILLTELTKKGLLNLAKKISKSKGTSCQGQ